MKLSSSVPCVQQLAKSLGWNMVMQLMLSLLIVVVAVVVVVVVVVAVVVVVVHKSSCTPSSMLDMDSWVDYNPHRAVPVQLIAQF